MIVSHLAYLYNDFLIQRLIAGKDNPRGNTALLAVSADILSTVLTLGTQREQMVDLRPDFTWTVCTSPTSCSHSNGSRFCYTGFLAPVYLSKPYNIKNALASRFSTIHLDRHLSGT
jgi:hypothetical protein